MGKKDIDHLAYEWHFLITTRIAVARGKAGLTGMEAAPVRRQRWPRWRAIRPARGLAPQRLEPVTDISAFADSLANRETNRNGKVAVSPLTAFWIDRNLMDVIILPTVNDTCCS